MPIYSGILRGLERLVLSDDVSQQDTDNLVKLSVDRLCLPSPQRALGALGLMLTCMYAGKQTNRQTMCTVLCFLCLFKTNDYFFNACFYLRCYNHHHHKDTMLKNVFLLN